MVELKREYVVPLRRKTNLAPKWRRSKKAVSVLNDFIKKHMKTDNIVICRELNEKIWENGIKNPPGKVSIIALKTQIAGVEKTLVNLVEPGIDEHLKIYNQTPNSQIKPKVDSKVKEVVKDAEVKEISKDETSQTKKVSEGLGIVSEKNSLKETKKVSKESESKKEKEAEVKK